MRYYEKNACACGRDKIIERSVCRHCYKTEWARRHPEKIKESRKKWKEANPEKAKEAANKWGRNNRDKTKANHLKYIEKHGKGVVDEIIKKWRKDHREEVNGHRRKHYAKHKRYILSKLRRKNGRKAIKKMIAEWRR